MNNKNIIIAGAIAAGMYLFLQMKKTAQRIRSTATPTIRQKAAQKIGKKIGKTVAQKIAQKMDISKLPVQRLRYMIAHAQTQNIPREELAALKAEVARRKAAWKAAVRKAAARKAAVRKAAAQKIGKKIGKTVAQKMAQKIKARRAVRVWSAKRQKPYIQRPNTNKKQVASRLFSGAEKSRIIPYSESSKHSYYGPKSHRLQNEGYGKGKAERDRKQALEFRLNELRTLFPQSNL